MDKIEHRAIIKFLTREGNSPMEIKNRLSAVYGNSSPSYKTVKFWSKQFKGGRESIEDDPRSGRPNSAITQENNRKVEEFILEDRRIKIDVIAESLQISRERVWTIIHDHLGMSKVSARWVPKMLSPFDKQRRVETSQQFLELCEGQEEEIIQRIVTGDETWIHHYDPESKQESMQWKHKGSPSPKKFKVQHSAGKVC
jgi:histone-lysine N-methyltransferase SETMAR